MSQGRLRLLYVHNVCDRLKRGREQERKRERLKLFSTLPIALSPSLSRPFFSWLSVTELCDSLESFGTIGIQQSRHHMLLSSSFGNTNVLYDQSNEYAGKAGRAEAHFAIRRDGEAFGEKSSVLQQDM